MESELNHRAFFALQGYSLDCAGDIIALLRSSETIDPSVREVMAQALGSGTASGSKLKLINHKWVKDIALGDDARLRWHEVGKQIHNDFKVEKKSTLTEAIDDACDPDDPEAKDSDNCKKMYEYYCRFLKFNDQNSSLFSNLGLSPDDELELRARLFDQRDRLAKKRKRKTCPAAECE